VRELTRRGYLIVVEYDDDPSRRREHTANDYFTFRACHCVQASTEPLAEFIRQFNPHVAAHANQIAHLPPPRVYPETQELHVFFGALHRHEDWRPLIQSLAEVVDKYRQRLRFHVVFDQEFYEALDTPHKDFTPLCPYSQYLEILGRCDIGLLPLRPTHMNRMKSDLKFIEHAAYGVVALASPTVYEHTLRDGVSGLLFRSPEGFRQKLERLIEDQPLRRRLAANAYNYVRCERQLSQHYRARYQWLLEMRDALPWLTAQLKARVPELV
jgi:glycosyltransferase involved in cell wall biosynthesis